MSKGRRFQGAVRWSGRLFLCLALGALLVRPLLAAKVEFVPDGDTLVLDSGQIVRLEAIDAPEMGRDGSPDQLHALAARDALAEMVRGKQLHLKTTGRDRHGRLLARPVLPGGETAQERLVAGGHAFVYPHPDSEAAFLDRLLSLQREAIGKGRGMWPVLLSGPGAAGVFVGNKNSRRFGPTSCAQIKRISKNNRRRFDSLGVAFAAGFAPYRTCVIAAFFPDE